MKSLLAKHDTPPSVAKVSGDELPDLLFSEWTAFHDLLRRHELLERILQVPPAHSAADSTVVRSQPENTCGRQSANRIQRNKKRLESGSREQTAQFANSLNFWGVLGLYATWPRLPT
jgi:hypothetical protein